MSREKPTLTGLGPYGAPYDDGSDVRWGDNFIYLANRATPLDFLYIWDLLSEAVDYGARNVGKPNPFWRGPVDREGKSVNASVDQEAEAGCESTSTIGEVGS